LTQKKYIAYRTDVIDMLPMGKGRKVFESDKAKEIAGWIEDGHYRAFINPCRFCSFWAATKKSTHA
jgi:hypothetical protein